MDPREMETLVQRLVQNPRDQDAITAAHHAGQSDPKSYAMLLEKVGTATSDPALACHWLTEAANVWSTTLGDAHRAARALMIAIDRDPTQATPADRLAELYREKGDTKALVALLERRAKALTQLALHEPELRGQIAALHEELGQLWQGSPLEQPKKAIENYRRAVEFDSHSQYSIYAVRELYKTANQWKEAIPYFELEQVLVTDSERKIALYQDEGDVRKNALDFSGSAHAYRRARALEGGKDATLKQQLGSVILERVQAGQRVPAEELSEASDLFVDLAEEYPGEHGLSYALCALELVPDHERAVQLAMYYGEQLNRIAEVAPRAAAYLKTQPQGSLAAEARRLISDSMAAGADDALLDALAPPPDADAAARVQALIEMANALARKAKKNEAAARFREVLTLEPANADAIGFLEPYLRQSRKYPELRDVLLAGGLDPAADLEQRQSWLREVAGLCDTQLRDVEGAVVALKELLALDPDDEPAQSQLKRLLEKNARWDELSTVLANEAEQTLDTETRISLEKSLAKLHEQQRADPAAAGEAWARIARLAPGDDEAITSAVRFFEQAERRNLAVQVIGDNIEGVSEGAQRAPLLEKLAQLQEASGEVLAAGEAFAEAASLLHTPQLWADAERCFVAAEAWDQAATATDERAQLLSSPQEKAALLAIEAEYLTRAADDSSAVLRLEQATELDPHSDAFAEALEQRYVQAERHEDLAAFLLRRADKLAERATRSALRKRAARIQRDTLGNPDAARQTLHELLRDGDDLEALTILADDAEARREFKEAVELLERLEKASSGPEPQIPVLMRQAALIADGLEDPERAIAIYERVLKDYDPKLDAALSKIAELYQRLDQPKGVALALERRLLVLSEPAEKLKVAESLADLYEQTLDDAQAAVGALDLVRELEPENLDAVGRLAALCEKLQDWPRFAKHLSELLEFEGDDREVSRMTRRLAEVLHEKLDKSDEALATLMQVADLGDEPCRQEYVRLGDALGWKGVVASKLVEWYLDVAASPPRNALLRGAFERFIGVGRDADAASVAKELARTRSAEPSMAEDLERIAVKLKDLDALGIAHDLMIQDLSGPDRAIQMVRQAEVLVEASVEASEAISHGEQALSSMPPAEVEPLLARLAKLTDSAPRIIEIYERQVTRSKAPSDKLAALGRATSVAAGLGAFDKARAFFDLALGGAVQDEMLNSLVAVARASDAEHGTDRLRRTLAEALANGGQGSRDGGRTRGMLLGRAADLAHRELKDTEQAFVWLGDAIVSHVDDESLSALERLADEVGEPRRAEVVLTRALEEVFDGPLVRKLLARRAALRREKLQDAPGAALDLKRLHDLSPADTAVMDQLSKLYVELEDYRGMVQLYEDQILRGKEPSSRAELARKVADLWESKLSDPREAADAWRRVLRMKPGDVEAVQGLERAKANMLKRVASEADADAEPSLASAASATVSASPPTTAIASAAPTASTPSEAPAASAPATPGATTTSEAATSEAATSEAATSEAARIPEPPATPEPATTSAATTIPEANLTGEATATSATVTSAATETESRATRNGGTSADESLAEPDASTDAQPAATQPRLTPPPLPDSALPATPAGASDEPAAHESEARVSAPPAGSAPSHAAPPPKPGKRPSSGASSAALSAPLPPSRSGVPSGMRSSPPSPGGGARVSAPPLPAGSRGVSKPPPPPASTASRPPPMPAVLPIATSEHALGEGQDDGDEDELTVDEDELTVDEDELIDDKP